MRVKARGVGGAGKGPWGSGVRIKARGVEGAWKSESAALNMPAHLENSAVATGLEKVSFHSNPQRKAMPKNAQTTTQLHSSHILAK